MRVPETPQIGKDAGIAIALTGPELEDLEALAVYEGSTLRVLVRQALAAYRTDRGPDILKAHAHRYAMKIWTE
jgi:hypothetical protein